MIMIKYIQLALFSVVAFYWMRAMYRLIKGI